MFHITSLFSMRFRQIQSISPKQSQLSFVMDPVQAVGLAASIVQVIDATTTAIKYLNDVKDAPKDRAMLAREGSSLLVLFIDLRYKVEGADPTSVSLVSICSLGVEGGPLDQFEDTMEELTRKLKPGLG
jgi:hypothetical protein